ncbi:NAD-dependent epimerase [Nitrospirillum pindoramense]|uniref:UDP-glucuronate 4-epimerase n=1 Tax=Nitrospirillum amazonense TaxID=28077 RepID=A0A560HAM9_9PROT|nr:NAD-dependent epimerase [Nitrospirillum amazonense]TWB43403.1 UDP-glucuronate 4-epimerase [Nitrospirillum amazonense]
MSPVLVTGSAGFIGNHVALALLRLGVPVVGLDNLTPYYDVALKEARLDRLRPFPGFTEARIDLADRAAVAALFHTHRFARVVHLAAQAGVRYSLDHPAAYVDSNLVGFANILEGCRAGAVGHLVYASTSSAYGASTAMPFSPHGGADHPMTLYAATKRANELMAHSYSHLFHIPVTGLRLFTVYGPWGRPDMALYKFAQAIVEGRPIEVYGEGRMRRDFTYIDDVVSAILALLDRTPTVDTAWDAAKPDPASSGVAPYRLYNVGSDRPVDLMRYVRLLEEKLGMTADIRLLPIQPGDVPATWADIDDLARDIGYAPATSVEEGVGRFVEWFRAYHAAQQPV